jgi:O-antigen/teichoic acid export membrane protein
MGVNSSGVRQIAEAAGTGDTRRIARTAAVLRRTSLLLGIFGAVLVAIFSRQVSQLTFGNAKRALPVSLLSLVILFRLISDGQGALIQGMRRIGDLAKMNVLGALSGTILSIPLVYYFRQQGVVPSLIVVAATATFMSWWFSQKIPVPRCSVSPAEVGHEASALLKLGFVFMSSGLMTMGVAYVVRIIILRKIGFDATGLYQSAWTLGGLYVGFILQAMGADFYPRLTASAHDNIACNRLVNEQTLIGLLLAGPGVIATLVFAPLVLVTFYSAKFVAAVEVLRWICLGVTLQVVTWPMGFIIIAKGKSVLFFVAELAWTVVAVGLVWICVPRFGLNGAGIAFFGSYLFHWLLIYPIVRCVSGFRWSRENWQLGFLVLACVAAVFYGSNVLPQPVCIVAGTLIVIMSTVCSLWILMRLAPLTYIPRMLRAVLLKRRCARQTS